MWDTVHCGRVISQAFASISLQPHLHTYASLDWEVSRHPTLTWASLGQRRAPLPSTNDGGRFSQDSCPFAQSSAHTLASRVSQKAETDVS